MEGLLLLRPSMTFLLGSSPNPFDRALFRCLREELEGGSGDNASIPGVVVSVAPEGPPFGQLPLLQPGPAPPRRPLWALGPRAAAQAQAQRRAIQARKGRQHRELFPASPRLFFPALAQEGPRGRRGWKRPEPLRRKKAENQVTEEEQLPPLVLVGRAAGGAAAAAQSQEGQEGPFLPQLDASSSSPREPLRPPPRPPPTLPLPSLALAGAFPARRPLKNIFPILRNL